MYVVATAGHVDHGKSTLVRALTGMEPDRWAEERRRGMTIDLGFAWTELPSGGTVAFVDVPGHERFVPNMLAGVGPAPAVMLVVAADEGWMPQSAEHLAALDALGVSHGLLVVTRSDLMEPELALAEAREHLRGTSLASIDEVCVSAATGAGLGRLRQALDGVVSTLPVPDPAGDVRLWVDRVFTIRGAGTVVTGTLPAGTLRVGDQLELHGARVTVRGLQALGQPREQVSAVARVAVNLRGVPREQLRRGDALLAPGMWRSTSVIDVRSTRTDLPTHAVLHHGSAATPARVRPLGPDTARLTLQSGLPLRIGDRGLLRDSGAGRAVYGLTVLDTMPAELSRRGAAARRAQQLAALDGVPDGAGELGRRGLVRASELRAMGAQVPTGVPRRGDWLLDPTALHARAEALTNVVRDHAHQHPLQPGLPLEAARRAVQLPDARLLELLLADPAAEALTVIDGRLLEGAPELPMPVRTALDELQGQLRLKPFAAPEAYELTRLGLGAQQLAAAVRVGELIKIADGIYLLPEALRRAAHKLAELPAPFTISQARERLGTTRRVAVPLLERFAHDGVTRRGPDGTHLLVSRPEPG